MKFIGIIITCMAMLFAQVASSKAQLTPEQEQYWNEMQELWDSIGRKTGKVNLGDGIAELTVDEGFYYLNPEDSEKILVQVWGNLPGTGSSTLGMILPDNLTPFDQSSWGVTIEYEENGYVSDENADEIDYDDLLAQMKKDTKEYNEHRIQQGYEPIELVGWAAAPYYDKNTNKLHWAKEIKFGQQQINTLNYNIRVLGRKGVLVLNFIAGMDQKDVIDAQLDKVLAMAEFQRGSRYEDFDPSIDQVAAYGLGALVAGKVVAKTGFLAAAILFLKKFGVFIVIGIGALLRKVLKRKKG